MRAKCVCFFKFASYNGPLGLAEVVTAVPFWSSSGKLDKIPEGISNSMRCLHLGTKLRPTE